MVRSTKAMAECHPVQRKLGSIGLPVAHPAPPEIPPCLQRDNHVRPQPLQQPQRPRRSSNAASTSSGEFSKGLHAQQERRGHGSKRSLGDNTGLGTKAAGKKGPSRAEQPSLSPALLLSAATSPTFAPSPSDTSLESELFMLPSPPMSMTLPPFARAPAEAPKSPARAPESVERLYSEATKREDSEKEDQKEDQMLGGQHAAHDECYGQVPELSLESSLAAIPCEKPPRAHAAAQRRKPARGSVPQEQLQESAQVSESGSAAQQLKAKPAPLRALSLPKPPPSRWEWPVPQGTDPPVQEEGLPQSARTAEFTCPRAPPSVSESSISTEMASLLDAVKSEIEKIRMRKAEFHKTSVERKHLSLLESFRERRDLQQSRHWYQSSDLQRQEVYRRLRHPTHVTEAAEQNQSWSSQIISPGKIANRRAPAADCGATTPSVAVVAAALGMSAAQQLQTSKMQVQLWQQSLSDPRPQPLIQHQLSQLRPEGSQSHAEPGQKGEDTKRRRWRDGGRFCQAPTSCTEPSSAGHILAADDPSVTAESQMGCVPDSPTYPGYVPHIGERVLCSLGKQAQQAKHAVCRFVGSTDFAPGLWIGLELQSPVGKNDGLVRGKRYFSCPRDRGVFTMSPHIQKSPPPQSSAVQTGGHEVEKQRRRWSRKSMSQQPALSTVDLVF